MDQQANISPTIDGILAHNQAFVESKAYERYATDKYPDKKLAIVSCMDTRLTTLLLAALGLKNGDAKIIKVAGAEVAHPFGSVMRSLLIAVCELGVEDVMIVEPPRHAASRARGRLHHGLRNRRAHPRRLLSARIRIAARALHALVQQVHGAWCMDTPFEMFHVKHSFALRAGALARRPRPTLR